MKSSPLSLASSCPTAGTPDFLVKIVRPKKKLRPVTRQVSALKEYLDNHYSEKITLEGLSEIFFVNKYTLSREFKELYGTSIINYLLLVRITHAKQMLRFTNLSVDEIGASCGITPLYYFSRTFKKIEGISPLEYRRQWS